MNRDKFYSLVNWDEPSGWLEDAKRRERWRWLRRITLRPHIKYLRIRRAFLLFLHGVVRWRFFSKRGKKFLGLLKHIFGNILKYLACVQLRYRNTYYKYHTFDKKL